VSRIPYRSALIIGAGPGISRSLARRFDEAKIPTVIASRSVARLTGLAQETGAIPLAVDAGEPGQVRQLLTLAHLQEHDVQALAPPSTVSPVPFIERASGLAMKA